MPRIVLELDDHEYRLILLALGRVEDSSFRLKVEAFRQLQSAASECYRRREVEAKALQERVIHAWEEAAVDGNNASK